MYQDIMVNHDLWKDGFLVVNNIGKLNLGGHQKEQIQRFQRDFKEMYSNVETKRLETLMEKCFGGKKNVVMTFEILETCKNVARTHMYDKLYKMIQLYISNEIS